MMLETLFFRSREQGAGVLGAQEQVCIHQRYCTGLEFGMTVLLCS